VRIGINALAVTPERPGGDVSYVVELARRCPRFTPEDEWVVFEAPWTRSVLGELSRNVRRIVCRLPHRSILARALWEQVALPRLAHRQRLDVFFAPVNVAPVTYAGPVVLTLHEAEPFQPDSQIPSPLLIWWRVMRSLSARRARRILTVSDAARQQLERWMGVPAGRTEVVHLGVDRERFAAARRAPIAPLGPEPYLLWVGRPYPRKDLDTLLSAFACLRAMGRSERLVLIGPRGWDEPGLQRRIQTEFEPGAVLRLPAIWETLPAWYAGAAAFVFPSKQETFGLPVLEAMASGTPVVASDIDALVEIGGDALTYFHRGDPGELAGVVQGVLTDGARRASLIERGIARAAAFDWDATAEHTCLQLRNALGPSLSPAGP
jgi:glycosyltransferase involved in cell wall biosynthesis